eukprot:m.127014 g.127014  ORF g.127014 m.127014 type:complete len:183 (+) comp29240_c0_seq1:304-852(+)
MSLEDRVLQFHEAAIGSGKSKSVSKEVATLRKFIHRNQTQRFTDKAVARLVDTVALHVKNEGLPAEEKEGLLGDALKMPFTVFGTKQKKQMLRWLEAIQGGENGAQGSLASSTSEETTFYQLIEIVDSMMNLMTDDGDTIDGILIPQTDEGDKLTTAFEQDKQIEVELNQKNEIVDIHILDD